MTTSTVEVLALAPARWMVRVSENGHVATNTFDDLESAENLASGQRIRLKLAAEDTGSPTEQKQEIKLMPSAFAPTG